ncbi:MAG TPA: tRNA glutamyl-Q(34) synthetase GluQRS [Casimicrobiaceae bacterium]|nr:tRNA glutamyl-Q(34) synthetase GluQRS [Casimicrobiaceae bacterium]
MNAGADPAPQRYRGRFAPSPTGPLHFGSLVAALASYCDARASGGEWLVRIEDVDAPRTHPDAERAILAALERYGFEWDGDVVRQSERTAFYRSALGRLYAEGHAYDCACTRREMETAPLAASGERVYPGTCSEGIPQDRAGRAQRASRVRVGAARIAFRDRLQGLQTQELARDVGDFVVRRSDGLYAYQLAVVVDDALQRVTHVVRGADLLASTPRQIHLQRLLGLPQLSYLHSPVVINASGRKLSKQTRAAGLPGVAPPVLLDAWRFLDQPLPDEKWMPASVAQFWSWAIAAWRPDRLPPCAMLPAPRRFEGSAPAKV